MEHDSVDKPDETVHVPSMITAGNWRSRVQAWSDTSKVTNGHGPEIVRLFERAFTHTQCVDQAWFGLHDNAASLVVGGVFLAAINRSVNDRGVWLLVDSTKSQFANSAVDLKQAAFAKDNAPQVFWAHSKSFDNIDAIVRDDSLWEAFSTASLSILSTPYAQPRNDVQLRRGKVQLASLLNQDIQPTTDESETIFPDEITTPNVFHEGAVSQVLVNVYERDPNARQACIEHYGLNCHVCDFNFEAVYGERGIGFIHIHHLRPVSGGESEVNPIDDLRPVCPNCHAMIHRYGLLSIEELKELIKNTAVNGTKTA